MAVPFDPTDPRHFTPDQRVDAVVAILGAGVQRVLALRAEMAVPAPDLAVQESEQIPLDVAAETRLHVPRG